MLPTIDNTRKRIEHYLDDFCVRRIRDARAISPDYERLWHYTQQVIMGGGKRLRPYMVLLAYHLMGGDDDTQVLPAAAACELVHCAVLIHDDIIDRDDIRRGKLNVSGNYRRYYRSFISSSNLRDHYVASSSLLAGDVLISESYGLLAQCKVVPEKLRQVHEVFRQAIFSVAGGELIDTEAAIVPSAARSSHAIALHKTARYSLVAPLIIGAVLADASDDAIAHLTAYGDALGIGFQYRDDLLGIFGDSTKTGKSIDGDIREGKHTIIVETFLSTASAGDKTIFTNNYGNSAITDEEIDHLRQLLVSYDVARRVEQQIDEYADIARTAVRSLELPRGGSEALEQLITLSCYRES